MISSWTLHSVFRLCLVSLGRSSRWRTTIKFFSDSSGNDLIFFAETWLTVMRLRQRRDLWRVVDESTNCYSFQRVVYGCVNRLFYCIRNCRQRMRCIRRRETMAKSLTSNSSVSQSVGDAFAICGSIRWRSKLNWKIKFKLPSVWQSRIEYEFQTRAAHRTRHPIRHGADQKSSVIARPTASKR